jgi:NAD(P)-dependent dehydrogenase (short-subunit alcohol dehydrogenase family)
VRVALFNAGFGVWKPFLQLTEEEVDRVADTNVKAAFAFAREAIDAFRGQAVDEEGGRGKRGTLLFTGATASLRGNTTTSSFSAAKFALRSLSQSLNKEFGKENIHVTCFLHVVCSSLIDPSKVAHVCPDHFQFSSFDVVFIDGILHAFPGGYRRRYVYLV